MGREQLLLFRNFWAYRETYTCMEMFLYMPKNFRTVTTVPYPYGYYRNLENFNRTTKIAHTVISKAFEILTVRIRLTIRLFWNFFEC